MKMSWIRKIVINGKHIKSEDDFYNEMEGVSTIEGFGRNLDALYDTLTESTDLIILENTDAFKNNLGEFAKRVIDTIKDAEDNNDELIVLFR